VKQCQHGQDYDVLTASNGVDALQAVRREQRDLVLQRFVSEDPVGLAAGVVNLYAYVSNDPVGFVDSLGLD
jgi:RHS repeat-associated protein